MWIGNYLNEKECRPPQCQNDRSNNRRSISYTRYDAVVDFSHDGLLSQESMEFRRRMPDANTLSSPIRNYCGRKRGPPRGFKGSVDRSRTILRRAWNIIPDLNFSPTKESLRSKI
ncbi:hypothetical protein TNCV_2356791 [Trichonephila clavipes]|nr:hypothetical protein TNCV_2356791 [Trichonephila clavipes]